MICLTHRGINKQYLGRRDGLLRQEPTAATPNYPSLGKTGIVATLTDFLFFLKGRVALRWLI